MMSPALRLARTEDIPALEKLIPESVRGLSAGDYVPEQIELALIHLFGLDTQLIEDGTYWVAEVSGALAGCGGWSRRMTMYGGNQTKGAVDPLLDPASRPARIRAFFVHPAWARRGIGAALMNACEQAARDAGFRALTLVATLPGERLYAAAGFTAVEPVNIALPGGIVLPCVRMTKQIDIPGRNPKK
jgi:N-acetylglutamate synthase-like GNAT family acetyltransferase